MSHYSALSVAFLFQSVVGVTFVATNSAAGPPLADQLPEFVAFVQNSKLTLLSAVIAARSECPSATPFRAGISRRHPTHAFEVLLLTGDGKVIRIEVDAICGEQLASEEEPRTPAEIRELRRTVRRAGVGLAEAIGVAARRTQGVAVRGELRAGERKVTAVIGLLLRGAETEIEINRIIREADRNNELLVLNDIDPINRM